MKNYFRLPILLLLLGSVLLVNEGCKKQKQKRRLVIQPWKLDKYFKNGEDSTAMFKLIFTDYSLNFLGNQDFSETYLSFGVLEVVNRGTWELTQNSDRIVMTDNNGIRKFNITELTNIKLKLAWGEEEWWMIPDK